MGQDRYPLIFINGINESHLFTSPQSGFDSSNIPKRDRNAHGKYLLDTFKKNWEEIKRNNSEREAISLPSRTGHYLEFKSKAGYDLTTKSLENIGQKIRLLNVREIKTSTGIETCATVYIPQGQENYFIKKVKEYLNESKDTSIETPKHKKLLNSIEEIKIAFLASFWQDDPSNIPGSISTWCEAWLRTGDTEEFSKGFHSVCQSLGISVGEGKVSFPEREVVLIKANGNQLNQLIEATSLLAELRLATQPASFWVNIPNIEQYQWAENLLERTSITENKNTSICILDTGVNNGHILISPFLDDTDLHSYNNNWGISDHHGHGTRMSGIAIFGDLEKELKSSNQIEIKHLLESVKMLPPKGQNDIRLYGYITSQAISTVEIKAPFRNRVFCLPITKEPCKRGRPSAWSGAIDSLTSGAEDGKRRLIIISAGNIKDSSSWKYYPDVNQTSSIQSPAQSWNALSIGAFTEKTKIDDPFYKGKGYHPIAPFQGLAPSSTTSLEWEKKWPIKPDVLFEGGNAAISEDDFPTECEDLSLITTSFQPTQNQFDTFGMTSAATAQASWMAAQIQAEYPDAWPETIRGLIVHSADWSQALKDQFLKGSGPKDSYRNLLRVCGYGIPNLDKALYCFSNSLSLIAQEEIQPFEKEKTSYRTKEMHFYEIPWPEELLLGLGKTPVKMRVTLSYFIEPGPGEIGWKDKYRYRSHGLKFDVNTPIETKELFIKRINKAARDENEGNNSKNDSGRWLIGDNTRHLGSIHSDIIKGTAADIATCNYIGVYPTIGWWRERRHLEKWNKKTRYSLIISLETPQVDVDLYTPVILKLQSPIEIEIDI